MEKIFTAKTLELAKQQALEEIGLLESDVTIEVLEQPQRRLFGGFKGEAKIKVIYEEVEEPSEEVVTAPAPLEEKHTITDQGVRLKIKRAHDYLVKILTALGVENFEIKEIPQEDGGVTLDIVGEKLGIAIGRRGETLDSLQYLAILASNKNNEPYLRITVDCNGYREKRRETLQALATRTAQKVMRQGRRLTLEAMNPYERRIIHSTVADIEGVTSHSTGEDPYRKVVISTIAKPTGGIRPPKRDGKNRRPDRNSSKEPTYKRSSGDVFTTSFERDYKRERAEERPAGSAGEFSKEAVETEKNATLYGKIEL